MSVANRAAARWAVTGWPQNSPAISRRELTTTLQAEIQTRFQGDLLYVLSRLHVGVGKASRDSGHRWLMVRLQRVDPRQSGDHQLGASTEPHVGMRHHAANTDFQVRFTEASIQPNRRPAAGSAQVDQVFVGMMLLDVERVQDGRAELLFELGTDHRTMRAECHEDFDVV